MKQYQIHKNPRVQNNSKFRKVQKTRNGTKNFNILKKQ